MINDLLLEINRVREIMGLTLLKEDSGLSRAAEKGLEYFGIKISGLEKRAAEELLEKFNAMSETARKGIEEIGNTILAKNEFLIGKQLEKTLSNPAVEKQIVELILSKSEDGGAKLADEIMKAKFSPERYEQLSILFQDPKYKQKALKVLEDEGVLTLGNSEIFNKWKPKVDNLISSSSENVNLTKDFLFSDEIKKYKPLYIEKYGQEAYDVLKNEFINGRIKKGDFLSKLKPSTIDIAKSNFEIKYGIKFSKSEVNEIETLIDNFKKGNFDKQHFYITTNWGTKQIVEVRFYNESILKNELNFSDKEVDFWMGRGGGMFHGDVWINWEMFQTMDKSELRFIFYHESGHVKDPAFISPKLADKYDPYAEIYSKEYFFHQYETKANQTAVSGLFTGGVQDLIKSGFTKKEILDKLMDMKKVVSGVKSVDYYFLSNLGFDNYTASNIKSFSEWAEKFPKQHKKFMINLYKNIVDMIAEVKRIM